MSEENRGQAAPTALAPHTNTQFQGNALSGSWERRREAARRLPPLKSGYRDPLDRERLDRLTKWRSWTPLSVELDPLADLSVLGDRCVYWAVLVRRAAIDGATDKELREILRDFGQAVKAA